jgi:hypothetical protein
MNAGPPGERMRFSGLDNPKKREAGGQVNLLTSLGHLDHNTGAGSATMQLSRRVAQCSLILSGN